MAVEPMAVDPTRLRGQVRDSISHEAVPYAAIFLKGVERGTLADIDGHFDFSTNKPFNLIEVRAIGFETKQLPVRHNAVNDLVIDLVPIGVQLDEVVVKRKKEKYSKKNNPAVDFVRRIMAAQDLTDPHRHAYYNYDKYERINLALNDVNPESNNHLLLKRFDFLREHIDTSEISGKPILNISTREKASEVHYRREPRSEKEYVTGINRAGFDDILDEESMQTFYEDVMREIDLYQNDVNILQNRFVSPLSRIATDFYKFYLNDTLMVGDTRCIELTFAPHNVESFGFTGRIYVAEGDSSMMIRKVVMNVPHNINLNFIDKLYLEQEYVAAPDGTRLKVRDDMTAEVSILPGLQPFYVRRHTAYAHHSFDAPTDSATLFKPMQKIVETSMARRQDDDFWEEARLIPITDNERHVATMMERLRANKLYYWSEQVVKVLVSGYIPTGNPSKLDIGPMNTTVSHNGLEGWRLKAGGMTTANLSTRWFGRGYVAWGTDDHRWKYKGEVEYSFIDKKYHSREFPVNSLRFTHLYDVDMIGQHYEFTNPDNIFLSLKRADDNQITYHRVSQLEYTLELQNNFSLVASLKHERQEATRFMPFVNGLGQSFGHYNESSVSLQLRFAPGEKFYQMKTYRIPINFDAPIFVLSHTFAPKSFLGNSFMVNKTELSIQKRFWFSAFGYTDIVVKGGHVWSRSPYPNLLIPNANLSYTIQPESFCLMNAMEFVNDSYASWDFTYWANGLILNRIPLLKQLRLREAFSCRGLWGHLSKRNDPAFNPELYRFPADAHTQRMSNTPYVEAGVGVENILKILRLDYVWRLTYRDAPGISKSGLRLALHITF
ncbi:MAG: DUF5686 and carboxypeptidase regulatory-like domain-containing protein [Bacteroidales bacterium]|nr:DUF5686 and carboxypeptidase regulatory-like domain-containing protein [Bacteroidales bacterium]